MRLGWWVGVLMAVWGAAGAAGAWAAAAGGAASDDVAEVKALRAEVERLRKENGELRARLGEGQAAGTGAKITDHVGEGSGRPATRPGSEGRTPRKVMFIFGAAWGTRQFATGPHLSDVMQGIEGLGPDQSFNILVHGGSGVSVLQKGNFVAANDENRRRAAEFLKRAPYGVTHLEEAIRFAINSRPDSIWISTYALVDDQEAALAAIREHNSTVRIPINSVLLMTQATPAQNHFLWRLAKESGGLCLKADGSPADEPVVPAVVVQPMPQPKTRPSVFRVR